MIAKLAGIVAGALGISVGWLAAIVAAVVALGLIIYSNWESIKEWTTNLIDSISEKFQAFKEWFVELWTGIKEWFTEGFSEIWQWIVDKVTAITEPIFEVINNIIDFMKNIGILLIALFTLMLEKIWNFFEPFVNKIKEWIGVLGNFISSVFEIVREKISSIVGRIQSIWQTSIAFIKDSIIAPLVNFFSGIFNGIWNVISSVISKIRGAFSTLGGAVSSIFSGIRATVVNIFGAVAGIIKAPINGVIRAINGALRAMNKIKVPKWVPGLGGAGINFNMIPMLAKGGNLSGTAIVGERGPELLQNDGGRTSVTPLSDGGGAKKRTIDFDYKQNAREIRKALAGMRFTLDSDGFIRLVDERLLEVL